MMIRRDATSPLARISSWRPLAVLSMALFLCGAGRDDLSAADPMLKPTAIAPKPEQSMTGGEPFLKTHCISCHDDSTKEGDLNLASLSRDLHDDATLARWIRVFDRVADNEMPPPDATQPKSAERNSFTQQLERQLSAAHAAHKGTVLRRLNRKEYENTLNDLFGTNLPLAGMLPEDGRADEFDNVGEALGISLVQMQRYLEASELVQDAAIAKKTDPPASQLVRASYADTRGAENFIGSAWLKLADGAVVFFRDLSYPSGMLREANAPTDGWYKVRVTGYAHQSERPITFSVGGTSFAPGSEKPIYGYYAMPPGKPTTIELKAWITARMMIEITPQGIADPSYEIRRNGIENYKGPGLAILHVEVEGPLYDEYPLKGHHLLFDGLKRSEILPRNPQDRERPWYVPRYEIVTDDPVADVKPVLQRIASRAFRSPVADQELQPYLELFQAQLNEGNTFEVALRSAVSALLVSPRFLYFREPPGALDDYALANRLSYFLTRTLPDEELLAVARRGQLTGNSATLKQQTERLLNHPHSARFVQDFTDAWLNLREIEFTNPDQNLFPEFDRFLQHSMVNETRSFFAELVDHNLPVRNVVKSDFAMLNNRLAEHYGITGVDGPQLRRVSLPPEHVRASGFLGQGSTLKVSANGTNTSPVVRGVWVTERILGEFAPPPPSGIPGVEPDIRGATTLRELLDKHRSLDSCRACHELIDPPGFALESFNPVGGWRERFRSLGDGEKVNLEVRGNKVRYKLGPPVDASGALADGRSFSGFVEFRDLIATNDEQLTTALASKLLVFATGREMGFSDRGEIQRLVAESMRQGNGVRDMIHLVVNSPLFRTK